MFIPRNIEDYYNRYPAPVYSELREAQVNAIPMIKVKDDTICSICLENITEGNFAKELPDCNHKFHEPCITPWLISNSFCPYCRRSIQFNYPGL